MSNFLLELLCEEIPACMHAWARENFTAAFLKNVIKPLAIAPENLKVFTTPRRIAIIINNIPKEKSCDIFEKKGPQKGVENSILEKFLSSNQKKFEDLYIKEVESKEYYFIKRESENSGIIDFLKTATEKILYSFTWPKPMRWGDYEIKWIRPITSIVCMLDSNVIGVKFYHYGASFKTFGHRGMTHGQEIKIEHVDEYENLLYQNFVILNHDERKKIIKEQIAKLKVDYHINIKVSDDLLDEVIGLVEWPNCLLGDFDKEFLHLPEQLIIAVIEKHQKIFPVFYKGKILNKFVVTTNFNSEKVIYGYKKVISARLSDAALMIEHDKKHNLKLDEYEDKLRQITFHKKLGDFAEKTDRITSLAKFIAVWVHGASIIKVEKAAMLCKADLGTSIVKDFPEMAGLMGAYYLAFRGEKDHEILVAVKNHYLPINADDICPMDAIGVTISIADKIDNLVGFISAGEKVTSTRDPFGLRRNAIAIIRTILENKVNLPLKVVVMKAADLYPASTFHTIMEKIGLKHSDEKQRKNDVIEAVLRFLYERLHGVLNRKGIDSKVFECVIDDLDYPVLIEKKCVDIAHFLDQDNARGFLETLKRVHNIIVKSREFTDKIKPKYSKKLCLEQEEIALVEIIEEISDEVAQKCKEYDFESALNLFLKLNLPLNNFMDNVMINCEAVDIKKNRFALLLSVSALINKVIKFELFL